MGALMFRSAVENLTRSAHMPARAMFARLTVPLLLAAFGWYVPSHGAGHFERFNAAGHEHGAGCTLCMLAATMSASAPADCVPVPGLVPERAAPDEPQSIVAVRTFDQYYRRGPPPA